MLFSISSEKTSSHESQHNILFILIYRFFFCSLSLVAYYYWRSVSHCLRCKFCPQFFFYAADFFFCFSSLRRECHKDPGNILRCNGMLFLLLLLLCFFYRRQHMYVNQCHNDGYEFFFGPSLFSPFRISFGFVFFWSHLPMHKRLFFCFDRECVYFFFNSLFDSHI